MKTKQQERAFGDYLRDFTKYEITPSEHGFVIYYGMWCAERKLVNDLTAPVA